MLVGGPFVAVDRNSLLDAAAIEIELLAERLHHQLLQIAAKQKQTVFVRKDDHVLLPFSVRRGIPHQRHQRGGIAARIVNARGGVASGGSGNHGVDVDPLQSRGEQPNG